MDRDAVIQRFAWALDHENEAIRRERRAARSTESLNDLTKAGCSYEVLSYAWNWVRNDTAEAVQERRRADLNLRAAVDLEKKLDDDRRAATEAA